jgi:hypothetical protein
MPIGYFVFMAMNTPVYRRMGALSGFAAQFQCSYLAWSRSRRGGAIVSGRSARQPAAMQILQLKMGFPEGAEGFSLLKMGRNIRGCKYPPAEPEDLRFVAPQRGLDTRNTRKSVLLTLT